MENQNPPTPAVPDTIEGASERHADLMASRDFAERVLGGDRAAIRELDGLQRFIALGEKPSPPATGPLTPQQASVRKAELMSSRDWVSRYHANPKGPEGRELARLQQIEIGSQPSQENDPAKIAATRKADLMGDQAWRDRYLAGGKPEADELDHLQRIEAGLPPAAEAQPAPPPPGVPEKPDGYRFAEPVPEGSEELATTLRTAAHHARLTQSEFQSINEEALRSAKANEGRTEAEIVTRLDADLHQIWGANYDRMTALVERYVEEYERGNPGALAMINERGLAYNKSLIVHLAHHALARYGTGEA